MVLVFSAGEAIGQHVGRIAKIPQLSFVLQLSLASLCKFHCLTHPKK